MKPYSSPYLVQRIMRSVHHRDLPEGLAEKYQANKPRTPEEQEFINGLIPLDYMGSAEFEFGAFGKAIQLVRDNRADFRRFEMDVVGTPDNSWDKDFPVTESAIHLFGFCHKDHVTQVKNDIALFATDRFEGRTKESTGLRDVFGTITRTHYKDGKRLRKPIVRLEDSPLSAWFDLDNGWMVGTSVYQMDSMAELLGIRVKP